MELRHLRYFLAVAEERHFGRAARKLHVAQPSLSQQIKALEAELGMPLLVRGRRTSELTAAGEVLLPYAVAIVHRADEAMAAVRAHADGAAGTLRLGVFGAGAAELNLVIRDAFRRAHPDVQVEVVEVTYDGQATALAAGQVDAAIVRPPLPDPDAVDVTVLAVEPEVAMIPAGHRLAAAPAVSRADLADERVVELGGTELAEPPGNGRRPRERLREVTSPVMLTLVVASGEAIGITAASSSRFFAHPEIRFVPVADGAGRPVAVALPADDPTPLARAFARIARQAAADHLDALPGARLP